jgi:hypothetical protein
MLQVPDYEDRLSKFERMCVVKAFREDRTLVAAADYISDALGQRFVESVPLSMERAWAESHRKCPLICLLSPGSDPTKLIEDLAKRKKIKTLGVSMGQGQEVIARKYMATATVEGQWVLLQNTHLGLSYLTELEQYLAKAEELHEDFRWGLRVEGGVGGGGGGRSRGLQDAAMWHTRTSGGAVARRVVGDMAEDFETAIGHTPEPLLPVNVTATFMQQDRVG